jgi:hypothetical protein
LNNDRLETALPDDKIECAVVIPNRNRVYDNILTLRFLDSLKDSDFPKSYCLYQMIGWNHNSRERGVRDMLKLEPEYVLVSDNDIIVPKVWWVYFKKIFSERPDVGAVGAMLRGKGFIPQPAVPVGDCVYCPNGVLDGFICYRVSSLVQDGKINAYGLSLVYQAAVPQQVVMEHSEPQSFIFHIPSDTNDLTTVH